MKALLMLSRWIDIANEKIGQASIWFILAMTLISAGNAVMRKAFDISSNALLEVQWYLFSAVFLFCAAYALQKNAHVRIDVLYGRFSRRTQVWIDILGTLLFLLPMAVMILWLSWPVFTTSLASHEVSPNAGGLPFWPARALVPIGFAMLILQALSEIVKRIAFLTGAGPDPMAGEAGPSEEEALAEEIRKMRAAGAEEAK